MKETMIAVEQQKSPPQVQPPQFFPPCGQRSRGSADWDSCPWAMKLRPGGAPLSSPYITYSSTLENVNFAGFSAIPACVAGTQTNGMQHACYFAEYSG